MTNQIYSTKSILCACRECKRETNHQILHEHVEEGRVPDDSALDWRHEYQVVRCQGCGTAGFRLATRTNEDIQETLPGEWEHVIDVQVFPDARVGRTALAGSYLLPSKIQRIYAETLSNLNAGNAVLCGIGIRAIIETVCKDQHALGCNLYQQIEDLVERRVLTSVGAEILHNLRTLGNRAAHEVEPHSVGELTLAAEVVDHLLLGVYVLPKQAKQAYENPGD